MRVQSVLKQAVRKRLIIGVDSKGMRKLEDESSDIQCFAIGAAGPKTAAGP